ncbi:MAG: triphosphoribosyl-dephospho-CoA synthase, partial [Bacteroidales bacterium]|nr:triphosphoribosyl-dephospho-CoA synthase [Bacteroidales bacterium]
MRLDLDLFARHIAPALRAWVRFVGSEPLDPMTARYNEIMREVLGAHDMEVREIPRLERDGRPVSASEVRSLLDAGDWTAASHLCPGCARAYLLGDVAAAALRLELDAPDKPGMVCPDSRGSHDDMDYDLMLRSIEALRPHFVRLAAWGAWQDVLFGNELTEMGLEAEKAMLRATGGVNTHKGALFSLGLTAAAAGRVLREDGSLTEESLRNHIRELAETIAPLDSVAMRQTHGTDIARDHTVRGALDMALDGYRELFADWLPYWREVKHEKYGLQKTLLRILSTLDDTCVIHR